MGSVLMDKEQILTEPSDGELLEAYRRHGDQRAFERLLQRYQNALFTFLVRSTGNRADAEDLLQETLVRVTRGIAAYREQGKFTNWMFGIAHHLCVDRARKQGRRRLWTENPTPSAEGDSVLEAMDPKPLPSVQIEHRELNDLLQEALHCLPLEQREVFLLRQHSELTFREMAEMLQRPLNTVLSQMRLATLSLKSVLQEKTQ